MELLSRISAELRLDIEAEEAMDIQTVDDACTLRRAARAGGLRP
jgi:acyl carrier protein